MSLPVEALARAHLLSEAATVPDFQRVKASLLHLLQFLANESRAKG